MLNLLKAFRPMASDFFSTIIFVVILVATDNVVLSTSIGIAAGIAQFLWFRFRNTKMELMQWASLVLVIVLGSATILTKDPRFVMMKPTIAGAAIASVMLRPGWQLRYLPEIVKQNLSPAFLYAWGYAWSALYFAMAGANAFVDLRYGKQAWEAFTAIVPTAAPLSLFALQYVTMRVATRRAIMGRMAAAPAE